MEEMEVTLQKLEQQNLALAKRNEILEVENSLLVIFNLNENIHKCYPFELCYSKCQVSTDRIKQRSSV